VLYHPGTHHIQIDIEETALQMLSGLNGSRMVAILPKRTLSMFFSVVFLTGATGDQLDRVGDSVFTPAIPNNEVDMVRSDRVV
jgi:hypothetical protein